MSIMEERRVRVAVDSEINEFTVKECRTIEEVKDKIKAKYETDEVQLFYKEDILTDSAVYEEILKDRTDCVNIIATIKKIKKQYEQTEKTKLESEQTEQADKTKETDKIDSTDKTNKTKETDKTNSTKETEQTDSTDKTSEVVRVRDLKTNEEYLIRKDALLTINGKTYYIRKKCTINGNINRSIVSILSKMLSKIYIISSYLVIAGFFTFYMNKMFLVFLLTILALYGLERLKISVSFRRSDGVLSFLFKQIICFVGSLWFNPGYNMNIYEENE